MKIGEVIRKKRAEKGITQEILAEYTGVSVQAVSKWETGLAMPDIALLPIIAEYFNISMDELFFGAKKAKIDSPFPDDGVYRVAMSRGAELVKADAVKNEMRISLEDIQNRADIRLEVKGSAKISGSISGNANVGESLECENIEGNASAGNSISCENVEGNASAGSSISCETLEGNASAGGRISCEVVEGNASAGNEINCNEVGGSVSAGNSVKCGDVGGDVKVEKGSVTCGDVRGNVYCSELIKEK